MAGASYVRELLVALGVDADTAEVLDFDAAIDGAKRTMELAAKAAVALAGAVSAVVGAATAAVVTTASYSQEVERNAAALGLTNEAYQELFYTVGRFGQNTGDFLDTMNQIAQYAQMAQTGSKQAVESFAALGISVSDLKGMGLDEMIGRIADGLVKIEDPALRAGYASSIFGEEGTRQLLPLLTKGSAGIDEFRRQARELGVVLDGEALKASADFAAQLGDLKARAEGLWHTIGILLLPIFKDVADRVQAWADAHKELIQVDLPHYLGIIVEKAGDVVEWADKVRESFSWDDVVPYITRVGAALSTLALAIAAVRGAMAGWQLLVFLGGIASIGAVPLLLLASALIYVTALFAAWYLVIQDVYTYLTGGESVIGALIARYPELGAVIDAALRLGAAAFDVFGTAATTAWDVLSSFVSWAGGELVTLFGTLIPDALGIQLPNAAELAKAAIWLLTTAFNGLASVLEHVAAVGHDVNAWLEGTPSTTAVGAGAQVATTSGGSAASSASLSPTAAYANVGAATGATSKSSTYRAGDTNITVNGAGWTTEDVKGLARDVVAEQTRSAYAAYGGA